MLFQTTGISTNTVADHVTDPMEDIGYGVNRKKKFQHFRSNSNAVHESVFVRGTAELATVI
jgi:hypothetical protein